MTEIAEKKALQRVVGALSSLGHGKFFSPHEVSRQMMNLTGMSLDEILRDANFRNLSDLAQAFPEQLSKQGDRFAVKITDANRAHAMNGEMKISKSRGGGFSSRGRGGMRTNYNNRGGMSRSFGANPPRAATKSTYGGYSTSQSGFNANQTVGGSSRYDDYDAPRRDDNYDRNRRNVSYQQPSPNENLRGGYNDDQYRHQRAGSGESDRSGQSGRGYGGERDGYYARNEKDSFSRSNLESEYPKWSTGSPNGGTLKVDTRNSVPPPPGLGPRLNQDTLVPPPPGLGRTSHAAPAVPPGLSRASPPAAYSRASPNYGDIQEDRNAFGQSSKTSTWGAPSSYAGSNEDRSQVGQSSRPTWGAPSSYAGSNEDRNQVSTSSKESLRRRFGVSLQKSTEDKNDDAPLIRSESPPRPPAATAPSESIVAQNKISRGKVARAFLSVLLSKNGQPVRIDQLIDLSKNYLKGEDINYLMHVNGGPKIFVEEIVAYKGFLEEYEVRRVLDNHNIEYVVVEKTEVNPPRYDGEAPRERARPTPSSAESAGSSKAGDSDYARAMKLAEDPEVREELIGQMLSIVRQANEENWKPTLEIVSEQVIMMEKMSESFKQFLLNLCIRDDPKMRMATNGLSKNAIVHIVKPEKSTRGEGLDVWEGLPLPWNDWPHPYFDSFLNGKRERITANVYYAEGLKNRIFVIPESSNESYENHMIELRDTYERLRENNRHQTFEFRRGDAVCVFDRKRGFSQRAVIQNVFPNVSRYEVFLVDRGGLREVDGEDILPLKKEFIFPPFGFFVVLPYFKIRDEESYGRISKKYCDWMKEGQVQITPLRIEDGIIVARIGIDFEKERVPDVYDELLYSTVIDSSSTTLSWSRNSPQHGYLDGGLDNLMSYQNNQRY